MCNVLCYQPFCQLSYHKNAFYNQFLQSQFFVVIQNLELHVIIHCRTGTIIYIQFTLLLQTWQLYVQHLEPNHMFAWLYLHRLMDCDTCICITNIIKRTQYSVCHPQLRIIFNLMSLVCSLFELNYSEFSVQCQHNGIQKSTKSQFLT